MNATAVTSQVPSWFWVVAVTGLAWNIFGVVQFSGQVSQNETAMMGAGMTAAQAAAYAALPLWMDVVFAIGTVGGTIGCFLLLLRNRLAVPVFAASLAGYLVLYVGDIVHGIFAAFGASQVIILSVVVAIAAGLLWFARRFRGQGGLG